MTISEWTTTSSATWSRTKCPIFANVFYTFCSKRRTLHNDLSPVATGEDGRVVQEVLYAGYESARRGAKVALPFRPTGVKRPIDLWLGEK